MHVLYGVHLDRRKRRWPLVVVARAGLELDVDDMDCLHNIRPDALEDHVTLTTSRLKQIMLHKTSGAAGIEQNRASWKSLPVEHVS